MNDAGTLPVHMLDIRELTAEAFSPCGQVIAPLRTGSRGAEISYDRRALSQKRFRARGPAGYASGMDQLSYRRHRFPPPIIQHAIWLLVVTAIFTGLRASELRGLQWGHSTIQMTFDTYGHLFPAADDDRVAMRQLQARLIG
jgi:integrase